MRNILCCCQGDSATKKLIGFAKNRFNKFYNPKLYKAPTKKELIDEEQVALVGGCTLTPIEAPRGIAEPFCDVSLSEAGFV